MPLTEKQQEYLVYKHTCKANGKCYIGITKQNPEKRWQNGVGYKGTYFWNAIKKYGWNNFTHEILLSGLTKEQAFNEEKRLIAHYCTMDKRYGYNICEGGQTGDNLKPMIGAENPKAVSVIRICPITGESVRFNTVAEASQIMGINHRGISKACRGISKTYKGYVWEYENAGFIKPKKQPRGKYDHIVQRKPVIMIDVDGSINHYESAKEAGLKTGIRANTITRYITGLRHDPIGRRWSYCL